MKMKDRFYSKTIGLISQLMTAVLLCIIQV